MDRDLPQPAIDKRRNRRRLIGILIIAGILAAAVWMRSAFNATVSRADIRTAVVETGAVENTLSASGEVLPEFEAVITSPITAVLQKVCLQEGSAVMAGEKIVELDKEFTQIEFEKQRDQLELKRNGIVKLRLELDKNYYDLQIQDSIKAFRINALQADLENARRLFRAGGGTREAIERAENDLHVAMLEKRQLENDLRSRQSIMQTSLRESEITAGISEKELLEFERKLQKADITAPRAGVLTFVNKNLGAKIGEGEVLARLADLGSFKVIGSISDNYAPQMHPGMTAYIRLDDSVVTGTLVNIHPSVANSIVSFDVSLERGQTSLFRPKQKVEIFLVTESRPRAIRVANGAAFKGGRKQDVFVLRPGGKLERRTVTIGLTSFDFVEITEGLSPGETVVTSDLSRFKHLKEVKLSDE